MFGISYRKNNGGCHVRNVGTRQVLTSLAIGMSSQAKQGLAVFGEFPGNEMVLDPSNGGCVPVVTLIGSFKPWCKFCDLWTRYSRLWATRVVLIDFCA